MSTLFDFLPIGAYRSTESGRMLRANAVLVKLNGYDTEAELLENVNSIGQEWYVDPQRRHEFAELMARDGHVRDFVSEVFWHKTRQRGWIRENAHLVHDANGQVQCYEGTIEDITPAYQSLRALQASEMLLREMAAEVPGMLFRMIVPPDGPPRFLFVSSGAAALFGLTPEEIMADSARVRAMRHPEDTDRIHQAFAGARQNRTNLNMEYRILLPDGQEKWVHVVSSCVGETPQGTVRNGIMLDITERKRAETELMNSETRWKLALESTGDGVWDWHIQAGKEFYSRRYKEMYGYSQDKVWQQSDGVDEVVHPDDKEQMFRDQQAYFNGETPNYSNEHRVRCADGSWKWVLARGMVIERDTQGQPLRMIGTHTDISARKEAEALIWNQAHYDPLTGLPNRRTLRERLDTAIQRSARAGTEVAVLFIDLDHFKEVNDTLGHDNGDMLLVEAAHRIKHLLGPLDTVARMGGDEFTVVLNTTGDLQELSGLLKRILIALAAVFQLGAEQVFVSASIGVAMYPKDATQAEDLLKHADQALYVAKDAGRNRYSFFTPELQAAAQTRLRLAADLRLALAGEQFEVVYQPIIDLATGRVCKAEALLRWHHPQRGLVSPTQFIGIAESTGLIIDIGEWVFRTAAMQVQHWRDRFDPAFQISVNKSPVQFQAAPRKPWKDVLDQLGLPGNSIAIEITEGLLLDATTAALDLLQAHGNAGMEISLDDFGTGYSSLTYLQRFAIDYIKIDQSFVRNLQRNSTDLALCRAIIVMAHDLGMQVVAEGVETIEQRDLLVSAGCDFGQGYLFSRPLSVSDFERYMANDRPALGDTT